MPKPGNISIPTSGAENAAFSLEKTLTFSGPRGIVEEIRINRIKIWKRTPQQ